MIYRGRLTAQQKLISEQIEKDISAKLLKRYDLDPGIGKVHIILSLFQKMGIVRKDNKFAQLELAIVTPDNMQQRYLEEIIPQFWYQNIHQIHICNDLELFFRFKDYDFIIFYNDDRLKIVKYDLENLVFASKF